MIKKENSDLNRNKIKAIILIVIYAIVSFLDCFFTYLGTPDLSREANPLIQSFGLGWMALITSNIIVLIVYSVLVYYSFAVYKTPLVTAKNQAELKERIDKHTGKDSFFAMLGYGISYSMILARLLLVIDWAFLINGSEWQLYRKIALAVPGHRPDLIVTVVLTFILIIVWFVKEHKEIKDNAVIVEEKHIEEENQDGSIS